MNHIEINGSGETDGLRKARLWAAHSIFRAGVTEDRIDHESAAGAHGRPAIALIQGIRRFHPPSAARRAEWDGRASRSKLRACRRVGCEHHAEAGPRSCRTT